MFSFTSLLIYFIEQAIQPIISGMKSIYWLNGEGEMISVECIALHQQANNEIELNKESEWS